MNGKNEVIFLHLDDIIPNRFQPREVFDEKALKELAVSIKEHGVIQPIIVREINNSKYEIIAGERRYKASALAGMTTIPAIIRNLDDKEAAKVALLENLQRKNLNPIEEARTYQKIIELDEMTQEELAKTMGKSQSAVANKLRLLSLPEEVQESLLKEEISERHARALLNLSSREKQIDMLNKIIKEKLTVRKVEEEIKNINMPDMKQDNIENDFDLQSLINPEPVSINSDKTSNSKSFLMGGNTNDDEIINYGEINNDEDEEESNEESTPNLISTNTQNLKELKENSKDIFASPSNESNISSLDSLLNIDKPKQDVSPAERALMDSENSNENKEDYFQAPDLMDINMPTEANNKSIGNTYHKEEYLKPKKFDSLIDFASNNKPKEEKITDLDQTLFQKPVDKSLDIKNNESLGSVLMKENLNNKIEQRETIILNKW